MRFAHISDCHLGGWRQPELQALNLESFKKAIEICIEKKVDFILLTGDLFDSAYPPIETLKETFSEFKKLKEEKIKCYIIAGSHDYSVSGKTFLDVLEKAGFCEICKFEIKEKEEKSENNEILLKAHNHESISIYGYSGKKSGLEIDDLKKIELEQSNNFKILMLHTSIESAVGNIPMDSINIDELPDADYYALGHLHLVHEYTKADNKYLVYPGPTFPNNFQELEDLGYGSFYIVDVNGYVKLTKKEIKLKEILKIDVEIDNALLATDKIFQELEKQDLKDKIILLRVRGILRQGKTADIKFQDIESRVLEKGAFIFLKNTNKLKVEEPELEIKVENIDKIEDTIISDFVEKNPSKFNDLISSLINSLDLEKQEDEKVAIFESRLLSEVNKILNLELQ